MKKKHKIKKKLTRVRSGKTKRMIALADTHIGSQYGYFPQHMRSTRMIPKAIYNTSVVASEWLDYQIAKFRPRGGYDVCLCNGDLIDGKGEITGGREIIESAIIEQCNLGTNFLKTIKAKDYILTAGSGYHVGNKEDYEAICAKDMGCEKLYSQIAFQINSKWFEARHFTTGGTSPTTNKAQSIKKDQIYTALDKHSLDIGCSNDLFKKLGEYTEKVEDESIKTNAPLPTVYIRAHVHKHDYMSGSSGDILLMTLPGLQLKSIYGDRKCVGIVDYGFVVFDVTEKGVMSWFPVKQRIPLYSETLSF